MMPSMQTDTFVDLEEIPVLRVKADMKGKGPAEAMRPLSSGMNERSRIKYAAI